MAEANRKLLILDLDETLIHAGEEPLDRPGDFIVGPYHVYRRPFLEQFLASCLAWFEVAVWTTGTELYAARIVAAIFPPAAPLAFVWSRERCTWAFDGEEMEHYWRKNMKKVRRRGYDLRQVIAVDDTPLVWRQSYGNLVRITPYLGARDDTVLRDLTRYLATLRHADNIRALEKRGWQYLAARPENSSSSG